MFTVCVITYNHKDTIARCLDSVVNQFAGCPTVIHVADDSSTDGTTDILKAYKAKYPDLIVLLLNKTNTGPYKNWLRLMRSIKTTYFSYIEGDDYFTDGPGTRIQLSILENNATLDYCGAAAIARFADGRPPKLIGKVDCKEHVSPISQYQLMKLSTIVIKTEVINEIMDAYKEIILNEYLINNILFDRYKGLRLNAVVSNYSVSGKGLWTGAGRAHRLLSHYRDVKWLRKNLQKQWSFYFSQELLASALLLLNQATRRHILADIRHEWRSLGVALLNYLAKLGFITAMPEIYRWFKDKYSK